MKKRTGEWDVIICLSVLLYGLLFAEFFLHQWLVGQWSAELPQLPNCTVYPSWFPLYFWVVLLLSIAGNFFGQLFGMA